MIYFDNAATTKPSQTAIDAINDVLINHWGNPSSIHDLGTDASSILEWSRKVIADSINADPEEIIFTSGASEANNLAIKGYIQSSECNYITSTILEHPSVYNTITNIHNLNETLNNDIESGFFKTWFIYEDDGYFNNMLTVVHLANNEIGTIQDIKDISDFIKEESAGVLLVDATQAYGHIPIDVKELGIDMMSVSGHKLNAPKGIGFLYVKKGIELVPQIEGGHQEHGLRAGTENVAFAYALAKVVEQLTPNRIEEDMEYVRGLTKYMWDKIQENCSSTCKVTLNGVQDVMSDRRLPGNLNITFDGVSNESLVLLLNMKGFAISSGSACSSGDLKPSRVLKAIGLTDEEANSTVRISLSKDNTYDEVDQFIVALVGVLNMVVIK